MSFGSASQAKAVAPKPRSGEGGLLGLAFHPDYGNNGEFFVNYTDKSGDTEISSFNVTDDPNVADPASEEKLLTIDQPYPNHNGGQIAFGPDGYLYVLTEEDDAALLRIEWLLMQNPRARFTAQRPRLPGQKHPGLGLLADVIALLIVACDRLQLGGLLFVPAHYHTAPAVSLFGPDPGPGPGRGPRWRRGSGFGLRTRHRPPSRRCVVRLAR